MASYMLSRLQLKIAKGATICYSMSEVFGLKFRKSSATKTQRYKIKKYEV
jgi:hypothetical protein